MENNWYESEQFYRKNIEMQSFQHRSADEYLTKFRPEHYTKPVHKSMKVIAKAAENNEVGWTHVEMESENDFRAFEVFTGIHDDPGVVSFSNSTISCSAPCTGVTYLIGILLKIILIEPFDKKRAFLKLFFASKKEIKSYKFPIFESKHIF